MLLSRITHLLRFQINLVTKLSKRISSIFLLNTVFVNNYYWHHIYTHTHAQCNSVLYGTLLDFVYNAQPWLSRRVYIIRATAIYHFCSFVNTVCWSNDENAAGKHGLQISLAVHIYVKEKINSSAPAYVIRFFKTISAFYPYNRSFWRPSLHHKSLS